MEKRSAKFDSIVTAAKELFWRYGISRVTIEEICSEAGVSKMTFYKYFTNKIAIAKYIIEDQAEKGLQEYRAILDSDIPYREKVLKTFELKRKGADNYSQELVNDIYKSNDPELHAFIEEVMKRGLDIFIGDLKKAQKNGDVRHDIKPEFIIYILNQMSETVTDKNLTALYATPSQLMQEMMNYFFYGILTRD